jgi:hypothetical protein
MHAPFFAFCPLPFAYIYAQIHAAQSIIIQVSFVSFLYKFFWIASPEARNDDCDWFISLLHCEGDSLKQSGIIFICSVCNWIISCIFVALNFKKGKTWQQQQ